MTRLSGALITFRSLLQELGIMLQKAYPFDAKKVYLWGHLRIILIIVWSWRRLYITYIIYCSSGWWWGLLLHILLFQFLPWYWLNSVYLILSCIRQLPEKKNNFFLTYAIVPFFLFKGKSNIKPYHISGK